MSKVLMVLQELRECAEYWSDYDVPIGIHERIDEAIAELLADPDHSPEISNMVEQKPGAWITEWVQRYRHNGTPIMDRAVSFTKAGAPAVPSPNYIPLYLVPPKREPLTNTQITLANPTRLNMTRKAFYEGVKFAEKHHGIGVGNE